MKSTDANAKSDTCAHSGVKRLHFWQMWQSTVAKQRQTASETNPQSNGRGETVGTMEIGDE